MMKKALITGITGQDGLFLTNILLRSQKPYEIVGVTRDIKLNDNSISILGKGGKKRIAIIGNYAKKKLQDYLSYSKVNSVGYLFNNVRKSSIGHISERNVFNIVKKYTAKVTQNDKISPHALRHTFATHLLNNGADLMSVKELLGHSDLSSTQIYTHVNIKELKKSFLKAHPHAK